MKNRINVVGSFLVFMLLSTASLAAEMVNINRADAAAISQNLVGIGPIKAEAIVSYRSKNGKFSDLNDLKNVEGIGPAILKKNKRYLSLSKGATSGDAKAYAAAKKAAKSKKSGTKKAKTKKKPKTAKKDVKKPAAKPAKAKKDEKKPAKKKPAKKKPAKKKPAS